MSTAPATPRDILSGFVVASGLSLREFARRVLGRDPKSLRNYLGGSVIPPELAGQIAHLEAVTVTEQTITVVVRR